MPRFINEFYDQVEGVLELISTSYFLRANR